MSISKKIMNRMFRRINGLVWDVMSGGIGLQTANGIHTVTFGEDGSFQPNLNPIDSLGLTVPAFATQSTLDEVAVGDIIVGEVGIIGWVVEKLNASLRVLDHNGNVKVYVPPKVAIMGTNGVLVVRNLFSLTGGAGNAANFATTLLPLLALGGGDDKMEKLLPLLLMTSAQPAAAGTAGAAAANPMAAMMPLLLMKELGGSGGKSGIDKLLPLMLMGGMGGGAAGGMNPMLLMALAGDGDLFGSLGEGKDTVPLAPVAPALSPRLNGGIPALTPLR